MCRGEKACTLPLPSCKDTGHTLASLEHRSGPVSSLRHTAERSRGLTSKPQCVHVSGWAQEAFLTPFVPVHNRGAAMGWHCCPLPTFYNFGTLIVPPRKRTGWLVRRYGREWPAGLVEVGAGTWS